MNKQLPQPGETVVLLNSLGGRLFVVDHTSQTSDGGTRVHEHEDRPGQPGDSVGTHISNIVRVGNREAAVALMAVLVHLKSQGNREAAEAVRRMDQEAERAISMYRLEDDV